MLNVLRPRLLLWLIILSANLYSPLLKALEFQANESISGSLTIVGSDTIAELIRRWSDQLSHHHPGIHVQLHAAGSGTAPPALIRGTSNVGAMSRPISANERQEFITRYGYPPLELTVALDAIAIVVNHRNPLQQLSLADVSAIFSTGSGCGLETTTISNWSPLMQQAGIDQQITLAGRSIQRFGRNSASGTYAWFRQNALCNADYLATVNGLPGNGAIINAVQQAENGIGYTGIAFLTSDVKALALKDKNNTTITPSLDNIRTGQYPLTRRLYLYINRPPGRPFIPETRELLRLIYSESGQAIIHQVGLVALSDEFTQQAVIDYQLN